MTAAPSTPPSTPASPSSPVSVATAIKHNPLPPLTRLPEPYPWPVRHPWHPALPDGTYRNPVVFADYSDPDAVRVGDDFYMTASSFQCTPGLPILHSRDLVHWTLLAHALTNLPDPEGLYARPRHGCGVWAPAIRFHAGKFWIFFPTPDDGIFLTTAPDPRGPWSPPHLLLAGKGLIDPCPFWDDDGSAWLCHAYAFSRSGIAHQLRVRPMSPDGRSVLGEGTVVFSDPASHPTVEGPKVYKRNGFYYLSAPAGGVPVGWQLVLRSRNLMGPYEPRVVLHQGTTCVNGPHQGALLDSPDGRWWFLHFQDAGPYGRVPHLQPVTWRDDWPEFGTAATSPADTLAPGEPVLAHTLPVPGQPVSTPQTSDDFTSPTLGLQWQWHANHRPGWHSLTARPNHLRLYCLPSPDDFALTPQLLLQKPPARAFSVSAPIELAGTDPHAQTGLIVMGKRHAALAIHHGPHGPALSLLIDNAPVATHRLPTPTATLRLRVEDGARCTFAFTDTAGRTTELPEAFAAVSGNWIGFKIGLFARTLADTSDAYADTAHFRFAE